MKNKLTILFYFALFGINCQNNVNQYFNKKNITVNFDNFITNGSNLTRKVNSLTLLINNDTIITLFNHSNSNYKEYFPHYRIFFKNDSVFLETSKRKVLFLSTKINDTTRLIDMKTLNDEYPSFWGKNIYLKDSVINVLGCNRECYVFKQLTGRLIGSIYSSHRIVFFDKKRLFILKEEDSNFDALFNKFSNFKSELHISKIYISRR